MYYIGIDGGGTKTAFGLFDENGLCLKRIEQTTCHFLQVGFDGCSKILKKGIDELVCQYDISVNNLKIGIGIAGYGNDLNIRRQIEEAIALLLGEYTYFLTNDMHVALLGGINGQDGIAVVAGTGSIAMAKGNHKIYRCGGWGYQLDDEGSAYWIGKEVLKEFCKQADCRNQQDELYYRVMSYFHIDNPYQIIACVHNLSNERTEVAKLAKVCSELAEKGHVQSQMILQTAGVHIAQLVKGLSKYFDDSIHVTYYGGVFQNIIFKKSFESQLPGYQIMEPIYDALYGAYLYAKARD